MSLKLLDFFLFRALALLLFFNSVFRRTPPTSRLPAPPPFDLPRIAFFSPSQKRSPDI